MQDYHKLKVWSKSMDFTVEIYRFTKDFPEGERFGLVSQIRRASLSICLNIAEGCGASSRKAFKQYLTIALQSLYELKTGLELALRLGFGQAEFNQELLAVADEVGAMLSSLMKTIRMPSKKNYR